MLKHEDILKEAKNINELLEQQSLNWIANNKQTIQIFEIKSNETELFK